MWGNRKKDFELKSRNSKHQIANRKLQTNNNDRNLVKRI